MEPKPQQQQMATNLNTAPHTNTRDNKCPTMTKKQQQGGAAGARERLGQWDSRGQGARDADASWAPGMFF